MKELHAIVSGRVQMVMYRDFCCRKARALGVVGWVKNLSDGTVEVVAQGTEETLQKFTEQLRRGSLFSKVKDVQVEWRAPGERCRDFSIAW